MKTSPRIVMATLGSLGDLHPMLALGLELQRRGHSVTVATTEYYRRKVEGLGLSFHPLRPDWDPTDQEMIAQCEDLKTGPEVLVRKLVLPHVRDCYLDLLVAVAGADLMVAGELAFAAPLVAEKAKLRWVSATLSPMSFFSAYDPPLMVNAPELYRLRNSGWLVNRALMQFGKLVSWHWWKPVRALRREQGLRVACSPLFKDKFSPDLALALFSRCLAQAQPDWPRQTLLPGFVVYDGPAEISEEIAAFLAAGDAPIVFTLGSTAVYRPGNFYEASAAAARRLGRRALLIGVESRPEMDGVLAVKYAPYSMVFPRAAAVVHQGGSGTTGQALRAGKPQLIVPFGWDQPDNGARVERLGAGLCLARSDYSEETAARALGRLTGEAGFARISAEAAVQIGKEDALREACDAIEAVLA